MESNKKESRWVVLLERVVAGVALAAILPLIILLYLAIRVDSRGPGFFIQKRLGKNCRVFEIWKFRTMHVGITDFRTVLDSNDPRVTNLGRWLRQYHLDELPQLVNVALGDMSFVGPRPEPLEQALRHEQEVEGYSNRLNSRPGMTSLAAVRMGRNRRLRPKRHILRYDVFYAKRRCLLLYLRILSLTPVAMLRREGV